MFITKIRSHWQTFSVYKNGENLKILIEIFRQKLIVSNVIFAFLDLVIFFVGQPVVVDIVRPPFSKPLDPSLLHRIIIKLRKAIYWPKKWKMKNARQGFMC